MSTATAFVVLYVFLIYSFVSLLTGTAVPYRLGKS